ncbi:MAG: biotin--protein ligase, partial [Nitrospirales bacterium]|nr:biotin--protein ligase [Nitrospirales bacterium]
MRENSASEAVLLWDESFLWGIMAVKALKAAGLPFGIITADEIRKGGLAKSKLLFVPGGWASNKLKALGEEGATEIRRFVSAGGNYLGFCGGAGLATQDGLGLLTVKRKPTKERVPSFSGRINLNLNDHPIWNNIHASPSP